MKQLFGYQSYWYVGAALTLGLLGWVGVEQATAQVSSGTMQRAVSQGIEVTVYTPPSQSVQEQIDYVSAQPMTLPKAPNSLAVQVQDDLLATLAAQQPLATRG